MRGAVQLVYQAALVTDQLDAGDRNQQIAGLGLNLVRAQYKDMAFRLCSPYLGPRLIGPDHGGNV